MMNKGPSLYNLEQMLDLSSWLGLSKEEIVKDYNNAKKDLEEHGYSKYEYSLHDMAISHLVDNYGRRCIEYALEKKTQ